MTLFEITYRHKALVIQFAKPAQRELDRPTVNSVHKYNNLKPRKTGEKTECQLVNNDAVVHTTLTV